MCNTKVEVCGVHTFLWLYVHRQCLRAGPRWQGQASAWDFAFGACCVFAFLVVSFASHSKAGSAREFAVIEGLHMRREHVNHHGVMGCC